MKDFIEAINKISPQNIFHIAVAKPKVDFVRELISTRIGQPKKVLNISDVINMYKNMSDFKENYAFFLRKILKPLKNLQWLKVKMKIGLNIANA